MSKIYNGVATEFEDYFDKLIDSEKKQIELYYSVKKEEIYEQRIKEKDKEIDRLNNIINELEKWLNEVSYFAGVKQFEIDIDEVLDKLKELKENNK